ncbi:hypothetical protein JL721_859 [Aureococcus anophagefferens]|nr:hypothetical protein JL721_859 [Aureococcus anophagefferens]
MSSLAAACAGASKPTEASLAASEPALAAPPASADTPAGSAGARAATLPEGEPPRPEPSPGPAAPAVSASAPSGAAPDWALAFPKGAAPVPQADAAKLNPAPNGGAMETLPPPPVKAEPGASPRAPSLPAPSRRRCRRRRRSPSGRRRRRRRRRPASPLASGSRRRCAERSVAGGQALGIVVHGPWKDALGVIGAQSRYALEPAYGTPPIDACPPTGTYPGRMNFAGAAGGATKRHQMVDRMALRFTAGEPGVSCTLEGEGSNRVGKYVVKGSGTRSGEGWDLDLLRIYTPTAPSLPGSGPLGRPSLAKRPAAALAPGHPVATGPALSPRQPRASAPKKGAWGAQPREKADVEEERPRKSHKKGGAPGPPVDRRPSLAVLFATTPQTVGVVHKCGSVKAARDKCIGLADEKECAVRVSSEVGDGVLFPPVSDAAQDMLHRAVQCKAVPPPGRDPPVPQHVVVVAIDAPTAKKRPWAPRVLGFATAKSAATYALHAYRTAGARLSSLEWHADGAGSEAVPRMHLQGATGAFNASYAIADIAALDAASKAP